MKLQESGENYLETILMLKEKRGFVRSVDIAKELGFSKPSISRAMSLLKENGYITMDEDNFISLTPAGEEVAKQIYERHELLSQWLMRLGVSKETALQDACKMEHVISAESFEKIKAHVSHTNKKDG